MQTGFLLVVCVSVVVMLATTSMADDPVTQNPMKCSSDGKITYTAPIWVKSANSSCGHAVVNKTKHSIVITGCTERTSVTVDMYSMSTTPAPTIQFLMGIGNKVNTVVLSCMHSSVYAVGVTLPGRVAPTQFTATEAISLKMSIHAQKNDSPATTVVIGDPYDLYITGAGDHYMQIQTCVAAVNSVVEHSVLVYDVSNTGDMMLGIITPATAAPGTVTKEHPLKATLTGFRLVNSPFVYLKCNVKVCDKACTPTKRKRTKSNLKSASIKFEVMGSQSARPTNGVRDMHSAGKITVTTVIVLVVRYLSF